MANGCRSESTREEWRGGAGRQRKKESLSKDGEIPAFQDRPQGGGGIQIGKADSVAREAGPSTDGVTSSMSLTDSTWCAVDPHRSPYRSLQKRKVACVLSTLHCAAFRVCAGFQGELVGIKPSGRRYLRCVSGLKSAGGTKRRTRPTLPGSLMEEERDALLLKSESHNRGVILPLR